MPASNIGALVQFLPAALLIQPPANAPEKAVEDDPSIWLLPHLRETWMEFQAPDFSLIQPQPLWPSGGLKQWLCSLSLTLSNKLEEQLGLVHKLFFRFPSTVL